MKLVTLINIVAFFLLLVAQVRSAGLYPNPHGPYEYTDATFAVLVPSADAAAGILNASSLEVISISQLGAGVPQAKQKEFVIGAEMINGPTYDTLGWDFVQVVANQTMVHSTLDYGYNAHYYAGFVEGYVTHTRVAQAIIGQAPQMVLTPNAQLWIEQHIAYMQAQVDDNMRHGYASPFWTHVGNLLGQLKGIQEGYMRALSDYGLTNTTNYPSQTFFQIFLLNFDNEIGDVIQGNDTVFSSSSSSSSSRGVTVRPITQQHCSALVRVTDDDIFFSHITWGSYNTMLRQFKVYVFKTTVTMSSYPGTIASGDDWYTTSNNLTIQETTNGNNNNTLAALYVVPDTVSEFLRVMTATYLATTGDEWVANFENHNSGTYCNQYMVLNYNLYTAGQTGAQLADGLLWVAEQIPGNVTSADVTDVLRNTSYWASFNLPYFKNIYDVTGFEELYEQFGDYFSYTKYARPEIFKRNMSDVNDLRGMQAIMRYNNWQHDPLSVIPNCPHCNPAGSPWLSIAARGDLANVTNGTRLPDNPNYASIFGNVAMGAIDAKITSAALLQNQMMGSVICGPTSDQQPVFNYDLQYPGQRPPGIVNTFTFPWVFFNVVKGTDVPPPVSAGSNGGDSHTAVIVGVCVGVPVGIVLIALVAKHMIAKKRQDDYVPI